MSRVLCIDMDGTLAKGVAWKPSDIARMKVDRKVAVWVEKKYQSNYIIIHTARRDNLIPETLKWLRVNNIRYHAISNLKSPADLYLDDKAKHPRSLK